MGSAAGRPMVQVVGVSKTFRAVGGKQHAAVGDLTLNVMRGEFVSVVGPSGCGKTTLLRLIAGLLRPDSGKIFVDGSIVDEAGKQCAMVFQRYGLLPWRTVMGNVELALELHGVGKRERRAKAAAMINKMGLSGFEGAYPSQLSGGMMQRVALGRALTKEPRVILMDEPFAAIDLQTREELQREMGAIWETLKTTVIFVTHSIDEAVYLGDRVIVIGGSPGTCIGDIQVDLPRPRHVGDVRALPRFGEIGHQIRELLRVARGSKTGDSSLTTTTTGGLS